MKSFPALLLSALGTVFLAACNYDAALTARPTRDIDPRMLGDWVIIDKDTGKTEAMQVRQLDKANYVIALDGDLYSAFHSDFSGTPFLSVQDLNTPDRLYLFFTASMSIDGRQLTVQTLSTKVVPGTTKGRGALQKLIKANLANPDLFEQPLIFNRPAAP
jgi:hypothetical protein